MKLRLIAAAMLFSGDDLLMMKRSPERTLSPGMWAAVGGHMEPFEMNDPESACLREIHEETGFLPEDLQEFKLQYILLRRKEDELRQQFFYTARTTKRDFIECSEGSLHWVPKEQVLAPDRPISYVYRAMLEHYFSFGPASHPWIGTAGLTAKTDTNTPSIHWLPLLDPQVS